MTPCFDPNVAFIVIFSSIILYSTPELATVQRTWCR